MAATTCREPNDGAFRYYPKLRQVRNHLVANIATPLSAAEAAWLSDLSPNYFSTYFRARVGISYTQWAHRVRIDVAREMLLASDQGIVELARRVGYRDLRTFERAFKRVVGMSPRAFRASVRTTSARPCAADRGRPAGNIRAPSARIGRD